MVTQGIHNDEMVTLWELGSKGAMLPGCQSQRHWLQKKNGVLYGACHGCVQCMQSRKQHLSLYSSMLKQLRACMPAV